MKDVILPNGGKGVVDFGKALGRTSKQDIDEGNVLILDPHGLESWSVIIANVLVKECSNEYTIFTAIFFLLVPFNPTNTWMLLYSVKGHVDMSKAPSPGRQRLPVKEEGNVLELSPRRAKPCVRHFVFT